MSKLPLLLLEVEDTLMAFCFIILNLLIFHCAITDIAKYSLAASVEKSNQKQRLTNRQKLRLDLYLSRKGLDNWVVLKQAERSLAADVTCHLDVASISP